MSPRTFSGPWFSRVGAAVTETSGAKGALVTATHHTRTAVREWAGHASVATTMRYYARVGREDELRAQGPAG